MSKNSIIDNQIEAEERRLEYINDIKRSGSTILLKAGMLTDNQKEEFRKMWHANFSSPSPHRHIMYCDESGNPIEYLV